MASRTRPCALHRTDDPRCWSRRPSAPASPSRSERFSGFRGIAAAARTARRVTAKPHAFVAACNHVRDFALLHALAQGRERGAINITRGPRRPAASVRARAGSPAPAADGDLIALAYSSDEPARRKPSRTTYASRLSFRRAPCECRVPQVVRGQRVRTCPPATCDFDGPADQFAHAAFFKCGHTSAGSPWRGKSRARSRSLGHQRFR